MSNFAKTLLALTGTVLLFIGVYTDVLSDTIGAGGLIWAVIIQLFIAWRTRHTDPTYSAYSRHTAIVFGTIVLVVLALGIPPIIVTYSVLGLLFVGLFTLLIDDLTDHT